MLSIFYYYINWLSDLSSTMEGVGNEAKKAFCYFVCPPYSCWWLPENESNVEQFSVE
jgi:hypothetical protein